MQADSICIYNRNSINQTTHWLIVQLLLKLLVELSRSILIKMTPVVLPQANLLSLIDQIPEKLNHLEVLAFVKRRKLQNPGKTLAAMSLGTTHVSGPHCSNLPYQFCLSYHAGIAKNSYLTRFDSQRNNSIQINKINNECSLKGN